MPGNLTAVPGATRDILRRDVDADDRIARLPVVRRYARRGLARAHLRRMRSLLPTPGGRRKPAARPARPDAAVLAGARRARAPLGRGRSLRLRPGAETRRCTASLRANATRARA